MKLHPCFQDSNIQQILRKHLINSQQESSCTNSEEQQYPLDFQKLQTLASLLTVLIRKCLMMDK